MSNAPSGQQGLEFHQNIPLPMGGATSIPASATTRKIVLTASRAMRFRGFEIVANITIVSGHPETNYFRAEVWNVTQDTKIGQATITGWSGGTQLQRGVPVNIATLSEMLGANARIAKADVVEIAIVGALTLSSGLIDAVVTVQADFVD